MWLSGMIGRESDREGKKTKLTIHTKNPRHTILLYGICSLPCMLIHAHLPIIGDRACLPVYYRLSNGTLLNPRLSIHFLGSPAIVPCWQPFLNLILMRWAFHYPLRSLLLTPKRHTEARGNSLSLCCWIKSVPSITNTAGEPFSLIPNPGSVSTS